MMRFLLLLLALIAAPAAAQPRVNAIQPELVAEGPVRPGGEVELAIVMHTQKGWHGYWQNPGDAGLPMKVEWTLPKGASVGPLRYPVPERLNIGGLMNYVYERDHAVLVRLKAPADANGVLPISAEAQWLACTDKVCVPEHGSFSLSVPVGAAPPDNQVRFDGWRQLLPRPLATAAHFALAGDKLRVAIPLPASVAVGKPYVFPLEDGPVDYAAPQTFRRTGDTLVAELKRKRGEPARFAGVLALGDGRGLEFTATPGSVPGGGTVVGSLDAAALWWAVLGALAGGLLLNLMPCVFPILALKALHIAKSGGDEREARRDALGYAAGAIVGTGALGVALLVIRAGGSAAGWAFQLQDPRTILVLLLLTTAITLNLLRAFELPVHRDVRTAQQQFRRRGACRLRCNPCAGPFLARPWEGAAAASRRINRSVRSARPRPRASVCCGRFRPGLAATAAQARPWMARLQRILAIPMGLTALACLWLLWRLGGGMALQIGLAAAAVVTLMLVGAGLVAEGWADRLCRHARGGRGSGDRGFGDAGTAGCRVKSGRRCGAVERGSRRGRHAAG